jgi:hypothetical protein
MHLREGFRLPTSYCDFAENFGYGLQLVVPSGSPMGET